MRRHAEAQLFVLGALHWDSFFEVDHFPEQGECVIATSSWQCSGGKGANQAFYAAQCGAPTYMFGRVGEDELGKTMVQDLAQVGVDVGGICAVSGATSGQSSVWIDKKSRDYRAVIVSAANQHWTTSEVKNAIGGAVAGSYLLLQYEVPLPIVETAAKAAHRQGVKVVLNAAPFHPLDSIYPYVDALIVNEVEASQLLMSEGRQPESVSHMLAHLTEKVGNVVITLGARGVVYHWEGENGAHGALQVDVLDSHGAGDSFVGSLVASLFCGHSFRTCLGVSLATASYVVGRAGPRHLLPT